MTYAELTRRLSRLGFRYQRNAKGSHEIWRDPARGLSLVVPHHGNRDLAPGTLRQILRNLGMTEDELREV